MTKFVQKKSVLTKWKEVMFNPNKFFEKLPLNESYSESFKFLLMVLVSMCILILLMLKIGLGYGFRVYVAGPLIAAVTFLAAFPLLFLNAGIICLITLLFHKKKNYLTAVKVVGYSSAPLVFLIVLFFVPPLGLFQGLNVIYFLILQTIGIHKQYKLNWIKSMLVITVPAIAYLTTYWYFMRPSWFY